MVYTFSIHVFPRFESPGAGLFPFFEKNRLLFLQKKDITRPISQQSPQPSQFLPLRKERTSQPVRVLLGELAGFAKGKSGLSHEKFHFSAESPNLREFSLENSQDLILEKF